ncbi:MAG: dihydroorotase [Kiritimatiellae bacterium]|nr:dihydroorotase [Kiritimatiellia bacterium]
MMENLLIEQVRVVDPANGRDEICDFVVRDGRVQDPGRDVSGLRRIDGRGKLLAPGFWDVHVHFRDPGNPAAETMQTGAAAAAAGGFTHVVTMPNTAPAGDSVEWLRNQIEADLPVRIHPSCCATRGRLGKEPADLETLAAAGAAAFTDDGAMVADDALMRGAMVIAKAHRLPVMDHAVVPSIAGPGVVRDCPAARKYGWPVFPAEAELAAVRRDIRLCEETGCATHIQHLSCAGSVAMIRDARSRGLPVTAEATPHHMALAAEDIPDDDGNYRMNPPLGTRNDVLAIREGVMDGTLSVFATDHAPHAPETKCRGFMKAPFGIIGLETAVGVTWKIMVEACGMRVMDWVRGWTVAPAILLGLDVPSLSPGRLADMVLIDLEHPWVVMPDEFKSKSRNTPFAGWQLPVKPINTWLAGKSNGCR